MMADRKRRASDSSVEHTLSPPFKTPQREDSVDVSSMGEGGDVQNNSEGQHAHPTCPHLEHYPGHIGREGGGRGRGERRKGEGRGKGGK